jgi:hypothetical protein
VFVAQNIPLELKLNLLDILPAIVDDMYIDVDAGSADPDLSVKTSRYSYDIEDTVAGFNPLV